MWFDWLILLVPVFCQETTPSIVVTPFLSPRHGTSGIVVQCTVKSSPVATSVGWRKVSLFDSTSEDIDASNKNGKYHIIDSMINPHLTINNIAFSDEANYVCFATNGAGTGQSNYARLTNVTSDIPSILATPQKQFPVYGTPQIVIKCNISSSPTATSVGWERISLDGSSTEAIVAAVSNGKYHIDDSLVYPHLTINDVSLADDAYFTCFAANVAGKGISNSARVDVIDSPLEVHAIETEYSPSVGSTVTLQCSVTSGTATSIKWLKNNDIIAMEESTRLTGGTISHPSLIISSVEEDDLGYYICRATNGILTVNTNDIVLVPKDIDAPLSIKAEITHYSPILLTTVTLNCEIITGKATSVKWFQSNDIIVTTNNPKFSGGTVTSPSLIISQVEQIDFGYYVCQATDGVDTVNADEISLSPKGIAPTVYVPQHMPSPAIGQQLNISCTIELVGSNLQMVQWIFKDLEGRINDPIIISTTQPFKYKGSSVNIPSLTINDFQSSDVGNYMCRAINDWGSTVSSSTIVFSTVPSVPTSTQRMGIPEVKIFYTEYHVYFGSAITLDCQVSANPAHTTVQWKKIVDEYQSIIVPNGTYSGSTLSTPALTIFNADLSDEGYFICTATNRLGTGQSEHVYIDVIGNIPAVQIQGSVHQVTIGHPLTLICDISANPTQTSVQWLKSVNGSYQTISFPNNKYGGSTVTTPHLTILNTDLNDEGYYICTASNSIGTGKSLEAYLDVILGEGDGISSNGDIIVQSSCTGDVCYRLVKEKMNWEEANLMCLFRFGEAHHLVTISSQEEQDYVEELLRTSSFDETTNVWIGIVKDHFDPHIGRWVDGSNNSYSHWYTTELSYDGMSTMLSNNGITTGQPHDWISTGLSNASSSKEISNVRMTAVTGISTGLHNIWISTEHQNDEISTELANVGITTQLDKDDISTEQQLDGISTEIPKHRISTEIPQYGVSTEIPKYGISTGLPKYGISTGLPKYGISTGLPNDRMSTEISDVPITTELPNIGIPTEFDDDEISTEVLKVRITTELPYEGITTKVILDGMSEGLPNDKVSTQQPKNLISTMLSDDAIKTLITNVEMTTEINNAGILTKVFNDGITTRQTINRISSRQPNDETSTDLSDATFSTQTSNVGTTAEINNDGSSTEQQNVRISTGLFNDGIITEISNVGMTTDLPNIEITKELANDKISTELPKDGISTEQANIRITKDLPKDEMSTEQPNRGISKELLNVRTSTQQPKEWISTEVPNVGVLTELPYAWMTTDLPSDGTSKEPTKYWRSTKETDSMILTEKTNDGISANLRNIGTSTELPNKVISTELNKVGISTELNNDEILTLLTNDRTSTTQINNLILTERTNNGISAELPNIMTTTELPSNVIFTDLPNNKISTDRTYDMISTDRTNDMISSDRTNDIISTERTNDGISELPDVSISTEINIDRIITELPSGKISTKRQNGWMPTEYNNEWIPTQFNNDVIRTEPNIDVIPTELPNEGITRELPNDRIPTEQLNDKIIIHVTERFPNEISNDLFPTEQPNIWIPPELNNETDLPNIWIPPELNNETDLPNIWIPPELNNETDLPNIRNPSELNNETDLPNIWSPSELINETDPNTWISPELNNEQFQTELPNNWIPPDISNQGFSTEPNEVWIPTELPNDGIKTDLTNDGNRIKRSISRSPIDPNNVIVKCGNINMVAQKFGFWSDELCGNMHFYICEGPPGDLLAVNAPVLHYSPKLLDSVTLQCTITNGRVKELKWLKNNNVMLLAGNSKLSGGNKSVPSLTIKSVQQTDMGYYVCQATDGKTTVNSFIIVLSPKVPPILAVNVPITQYSPQVFTDITLQCIITSGVPTSVEWHVDNIPINLENDRKYSGGNTNNASLTIMSVQQNDRGYYMCFASDGLRTVNSDIISLLPVGTEPVVRVPKNSYTQIVGETITINCEIQSQNSILQEVQWIFIDNEGATIDPINVIMSQNLKYLGSSINNPSLTIFNVQPSDAGKYRCRARNMMGTTVSETFASLAIPEVPVVRISKSWNSVNRGEELTLECTASSNIAIRQIFWIKEASGNINVVENKHYKSSFSNPFLTISDVDNDDVGLYTCFASNSVGIGSSQSAVLNVKGNANITITELFFELETAIRESIVVICKAYVMDPEGTVFVTWKLNNSVINPTSTSKWIPETFKSNLENLERMQFRLTVIDPEPSDSGQLTCGVSDGYASSEKTVSLNVIGKPIVSISPRTSTFTLGDTVNITCTTDQSYSDYAYIEWYKNGDILSENDGEIIKRIDNGHSQLIIYDIQDTAQYECYGINSYGKGNRVISHISVIKPDVFYQYCPDNIDLFESLWIYTVENTLFIKSCPGDRTGTVSRYCNSDGEWEDSNYSKCITKGFSTLEDQSELLKNGVEVKEVNSILLNLLQLTDPDVLGGLTSGELDSSSKILENIATHAKERTDSISVDQLEIFLSACDNLLVGKNMQGWKQLKQLNFKGVTRIANAATLYTKAYTNVNDSVFQKTVQKDQLVVQVGKVLYEDIIFPKETQLLPNWITESTNQVTLSKDNFKGKQPVGYSITYYRNISNLFHEFYLSKGVVTGFHGSYNVNSVVIDFSLEPTPTSLQHPLIIRFEHVQVNHSFPVCAFWDFNALNSPNGAWSFSGSKLVTTSDGVTVCQYAHTTNFALLMSPGRAPSSHRLVLSIISTIGCVVSIIFLVITVFIYAILWRPLTRDTRGRNLKRDKAVLLVNFCVALTISYILFLAGVTRTGNQKVCTAIAVLLHYIFLVDISFMLAEGIELAISVLFVFATSSRIKWLIPLCWVAPAVIVGISMGATKLEGYGNSQYCWLSIESYLIWAFIGPALTVILINFIILMLVIKTMFATHAMMDKTTKERVKAGVRSVCVILPLFGVTWVLGVLSVNEDTVMFQYLFAVFNSLQGFFIFVFHAALNQQVREKINLPAMRKKKSTYRIYSKQISQSTTATRESFASSGTESVADLSDFNDIFKTIERDEIHVTKYQGNEEMNLKRNDGFAPNRDPISLSEMPGHVKTGNRREKYVVNKSGPREGDRKQNPSYVNSNVVLRRIVKAPTASSGKQNQDGGNSHKKDQSRSQYNSQTESRSDFHYDSPVLSNDETTRISVDNHSFTLKSEHHRIANDYQHQRGDKISCSTYL